MTDAHSMATAIRREFIDVVIPDLHRCGGAWLMGDLYEELADMRTLLSKISIYRLLKLARGTSKCALALSSVEIDLSTKLLLIERHNYGAHLKFIQMKQALRNSRVDINSARSIVSHRYSVSNAVLEASLPHTSNMTRDAYEYLVANGWDLGPVMNHIHGDGTAVMNAAINDRARLPSLDDDEYKHRQMTIDLNSNLRYIRNSITDWRTLRAIYQRHKGDDTVTRNYDFIYAIQNQHARVADFVAILKDTERDSLHLCGGFMKEKAYTIVTALTPRAVDKLSKRFPKITVGPSLMRRNNTSDPYDNEHRIYDALVAGERWLRVFDREQSPETGGYIVAYTAYYNKLVATFADEIAYAAYHELSAPGGLHYHEALMWFTG